MLNGYETPPSGRDRVTPVCRGWGQIVGWGLANAAHVFLHLPGSAVDLGMGLDYHAAIWYVRHTIEHLMRRHPQIRVYFGAWTSGLSMVRRAGRSSHIHRSEHTKLRYFAVVLFSKEELYQCWDPTASNHVTTPTYAYKPWVHTNRMQSMFTLWHVQRQNMASSSVSNTSSSCNILKAHGRGIQRALNIPSRRRLMDTKCIGGIGQRSIRSISSKR